VSHFNAFEYSANPEKYRNEHPETVASDSILTTGYKCGVCGKVLKSKSGLTRHRTRMHGKQAANNETPLTTPLAHNTSIVKRINLKSEYDKMTEVINPKQKEKKYRCGSCGHEFDEKVNFCAKCGIAFA